MDIISVHVPKTAGTSFRLVLQQVYGKDAVAEDYPDRYDNPLMQYNDLALSRDPLKALLANKRVVHGHFQVRKYDGIFPEARRIVWLRNPISRIVSNFYYFKAVPINPNFIQNPIHVQIQSGQMSLLDFAQLPAMQNACSRDYFRGAGLDEFFFVGLTERFDRDLKELADKLHWGDVHAPIVNETRHSDYSKLIDVSTLEKMHLLNADDMHLYDQAVALADARQHRRL